jgi:hypothetical protein
MSIDVVSAAREQAIDCGNTAAWCIDADTRDNVLARRNVLAGLWAGRLMQIPNHMVQRYAAAVHHADCCELGDDDIIDKLLGDFNRCGIGITREEVCRKLCEFYRQAIMQTRETD